MNRRGFVLMTMCALGFLIAIVIFYQTLGVQMPGETDYLGEMEVTLNQMYGQGEEMLFFIDTSVMHAIEKSKTANNIEIEFTNYFQVYLDQFNELYDQELSVTSYSFIVTSNQIAGVSSDYIILTTDKIEYKVHPNFRISYNPDPLSSTQPLF